MRRFVCIAGLLVATALACSSTSPTQACTDLSTAVCTKLSQCAPPVLEEVYGDTTTCATHTAMTCESGLALKNTGDTADEAEKCSKAYASIACTDLFTEQHSPRIAGYTTAWQGGERRCVRHGRAVREQRVSNRPDDRLRDLHRGGAGCRRLQRPTTDCPGQPRNARRRR